jgi:hypothetical protein
MMGSSMSSTSWTNAFENGTLIEVNSLKKPGVTIAMILDGTSHTIVLAESSDRDESQGGRWVSGYNCFSQDNGGVNASGPGEIFSLHKGGAFAAFADGSTRFLVVSIDRFVLGSLCTRAHGEPVSDSAF